MQQRRNATSSQEGDDSLKADRKPSANPTAEMQDRAATMVFAGTKLRTVSNAPDFAEKPMANK